MTTVREGLERAHSQPRRAGLGLNVTTPLKQAILPLVDVLSPAARRAGSANTVVFTPDSATGDSTDGAGFLAALDRGVGRTPARAVILGTGGAARAVAAALLERGTSVTVVGRNAQAGRTMARDLGVRWRRLDPPMLAAELPQAGLLVNATPLGGSQFVGASPLPPSVRLHPALIVFDLVYRSRRTRLLAQAEASGCRIVEGVEMLIEQGARSFQLWTSLRAPIETMREAAHRALDSPPGSVGHPSTAAMHSA